MKFPYDSLLPEERKAIWKSELGALSHKVSISAAALDQLSSLDLDGRTITNSVHILALYKNGEGEGREILVEDVKKVLLISTGFQSDEVRGQIDEFCKS